MGAQSMGHKSPYPKSVFFIIGNEFCERFSYYGMRAILVLYFTQIIGYSDNQATQFYHIFVMVCYFTPVIGAIIADSILGKFWTILILSIVYASGNVLISFASINGTVWLTFLGLCLIALGTGGIKPCVSAFGGDQFSSDRKKQLQQFFSMFYIAINGGSLISTFLTPMLRQDVKCNEDGTSCYPVAFGVPAILMVVALLLFVLGRFLSTYVLVPPGDDNVLIMVTSCVFRALCKKVTSKEKKNHWLDYASDKYDETTINDVKALMRVLFLYIPLPIFWALYEQQGSRWTLQATRLNGQFSNYILKPDQVHTLNPLLVIAFVPIFEYVIYPLLEKINFTKPLRKMTLGGIIAGIAFIICAILQMQIEQDQPPHLNRGSHHVIMVNGLNNCHVDYMNITVMPNQIGILPNVEDELLENFEQKFNLHSNDSSCSNEGLYFTSELYLGYEKNTTIIFVSEKLISKNQIDVIMYENLLVKPKEGALLFTVFNIQNYNNETFTENGNNLDSHNVISHQDGTTLGYLNLAQLNVGSNGTTIHIENKDKSLNFYTHQGGTYFLFIHGDMQKIMEYSSTEIVAKNRINVLWQAIQYVVMTCGEILFSITGLAFAYSQAPKSMKSVLAACWHLTNAFGNLIIAVIADIKIFPEQSHEFFFFGGLLILDMLVFAIMAYYYVPIEFNDDKPKEENQVHNGIDGK